jgi:hypothetical protein
MLLTVASVVLVFCVNTGGVTPSENAIVPAASVVPALETVKVEVPLIRWMIDVLASRMVLGGLTPAVTAPIKMLSEESVSKHEMLFVRPLFFAATMVVAGEARTRPTVAGLA